MKFNLEPLRTSTTESLRKSYLANVAEELLEEYDANKREIAELRSVLREVLPWLTGESASLYAKIEELLAKE